MNPMRLRMNLSAGYLKKRIKKKWRGLVSYIHQQYDLAKEELEKIRQSQKKAADKHTGANHSANVRFTDS